MDAGNAALILAVVALVLAASTHSSIALVLAIVALVLSFSEYKEVAVILSIIALALAIIIGSGTLIHV